MKIREFTIPIEYCRSITIHNRGNFLLDSSKGLNKKDLLEVLKGKGEWSSTRTDDHPEFTKLRNHLEELGYIKTERGWWNGDTVLKRFKLNGSLFKKGELFPSSGAINIGFKLKEKKL